MKKGSIICYKLIVLFIERGGLMNNIIGINTYRMRKNQKTMYQEIINELKSKKQKGKEYTLSDAEDIANRILQETNDYIGDSFTPIVKIAQNFNFCTYKTDLPGNLSGHIFIGGEETSAEFGHDKVIIVDEDDELFQQRFVTAHELAHYLFDYLGNSEYLHKQYAAAYYKDMHNEPEERIANRFAACILMPKDLFLSKYSYARDLIDNRNFAISYLSKFFKTNTDSIELRIKEVLAHV